MKTGYRTVLIALATTAALVGCVAPFQGDTDSADGGTIAVTFSGIEAQNLFAPDIDMDVASLTVRRR